MPPIIPIPVVPYSIAALNTRVRAFVARPRFIKNNIRTSLLTGIPIAFNIAVDYAINKAWADATIRERMEGRISPIIANAVSIKAMLNAELTPANIPIINANFNFWHNRMCSDASYGMRYGIWQKFINMTFKYLYCFEALGSTHIGINWNECHCPIDSVIARRAAGLLLTYGIPDPHNIATSIAKHGDRYGVTWNNITNSAPIFQYNVFQDTINDLCLRQIPNIPSKLFFDFLYW